MNALLLPFVNFNEAGIDLDEPYVGVYNFDMNNIQSIEAYAFQGAFKLASLVMPKSMPIKANA